MIAVLAPLRAASIAARRPAPPAPMTTTSYSCFMYSSLISSPQYYEGHVVNVPFSHCKRPQVAQEYEPKAGPEPKAV